MVTVYSQTVTGTVVGTREVTQQLVVSQRTLCNGVLVANVNRMQADFRTATAIETKAFVVFTVILVFTTRTIVHTIATQFIRQVQVYAGTPKIPCGSPVFEAPQFEETIFGQKHIGGQRQE